MSSTGGGSDKNDGAGPRNPTAAQLAAAAGSAADDDVPGPSTDGGLACMFRFVGTLLQTRKVSCIVPRMLNHPGISAIYKMCTYEDVLHREPRLAAYSWVHS